MAVELVAELGAARVSRGVADLPAMGIGVTATVVVPISPAQPTADHMPVATVIGGTALLGAVIVQGITARSITSVTVQVRNTGTAALVAAAGRVAVITAGGAA